MPESTAKRRLRRHIEDLHRRPPGAISGYSLPDLQRFHREQHHRYGADHLHAGENRGPSRRPPGWSTGEDVVPIGKPFFLSPIAPEEGVKCAVCGVLATHYDDDSLPYCDHPDHNSLPKEA